MAIQLILCVETNKKSDTDSIYITETLNHYFKIDNNVKISKVYMETKTKYKSKDVLKDINEKIKLYSFGDSKVIYCIDTDDFEINQEHKRQLEEIGNYCEDNNYDIIWFCHDVEDVFLGKRISDKQKTAEAKTFRRKNAIQQIDTAKLTCNLKICHTSNILNVLCKYLEQK